MEKLQLYMMQHIFQVYNNHKLLYIDFVKSHVQKGYDINMKLMDQYGNFDKNLFYFYMINAKFYDLNELIEIIDYFIENGLKITDDSNYFYMFLQKINILHFHETFKQIPIEVINDTISKLQKCGMKVGNVKLYYDYTSKENKCLLVDYSDDKKTQPQHYHEIVYFSSYIFKLDYKLENLFHHTHLMCVPHETQDEILINKNELQILELNCIAQLKGLYYTSWGSNKDIVTIQKLNCLKTKTPFNFGGSTSTFG